LQTLKSGEDYIARSFTFCTRHQVLLWWSNREDDTDGARSAYGRHETCIQAFGRETCGERDRLEDLGVDGIIIHCVFKNWDGDIDMTQDRDRWRALVNEVMNFITLM
jgi:hypothetical protein